MSLVRPSFAAILMGMLCGSALAGPVRFAPDDLGQDSRITLSPGFSSDGRTIWFAQSECLSIGGCPQRLKRSERTATGWTKPQIVPLPGGPGVRADWPSVSPDGRTLWFSASLPNPDWKTAEVVEDFAIYSLDLTDPDAAPVRLDAPMNRLRGGPVARLRFVNNESGPVQLRDGSIYFFTEWLDGDVAGERDVYLARPDGMGGFRPELVPDPISTPAREDTPWVDPGGRLMILASPARGGVGGTDLFVSVRGDDGWSAPEALGPRANSADADFAGRLTPDGRDLVFTSTRPVSAGTGAGALQVWTVPVAEVPVLAHAVRRAGLSSPSATP